MAPSVAPVELPPMMKPALGFACNSLALSAAWTRQMKGRQPMGYLETAHPFHRIVRIVHWCGEWMLWS
jgi:hypothetical protein